MDDKQEFQKHFQEQYRQLYKHPDYFSKGGIFKKKRRKQLLGILGKSGRNRPLEGKSKNSFWYDVRETVRNGLIDLQLFVETADDKNVNSVMNKETLSPLVYAFLNHSRLYHNNKEDSSKAKVAQMLVEYGLDYLKNSKYVYPNQRQAINETIDLSKQITILFLTDKEKDSFFNGEIKP
jgi:hypothetical protein